MRKNIYDNNIIMVIPEELHYIKYDDYFKDKISTKLRKFLNSIPYKVIYNDTKEYDGICFISNNRIYPNIGFPNCKYDNLLRELFSILKYDLCNKINKIEDSYLKEALIKAYIDGKEDIANNFREIIKNLDDVKYYNFTNIYIDCIYKKIMINPKWQDTIEYLLAYSDTKGNFELDEDILYYKDDKFYENYKVKKKI